MRLFRYFRRYFEEGFGEVARSAPPLLRTVLMSASLLLGIVPSLASAQTTLIDPEGYIWDVQATSYGSIKEGTNDSYDEWPRLCIAPSNTSASTACVVTDIYDAGGVAATTELGGRQLVTAPVTLQGLTIQRKIYVPDSTSSSVGFLRYLEVLTNPGTSNKTIKVRVGSPAANSGTLGSDTSTTVKLNSNGSANTEPGLLWMVTDDTQTDPAIGHIFAGAGATNPMTYGALGNYTNNKDGVVWEYANVTIPAGKTRYILHFQEQRLLSNDAISVAQALVLLPGYATNGLTLEERQGVLNFVLPPIAEANGPYAGVEGATITLSAAGSGAITGNITSYAWDCTNDGTFDVTGTTQTATCTYTKYGNYTALLKVTDSNGRTGTDTARVTVSNIPPTLATPSVTGTLVEGSTLTFTASASDPGTSDTLTYAWTFGDGTTGTGASVSKVYADNGTFSWTVTASDSAGGTDTESGSVVIANANPSITQLTIPSSALEGASVSASAKATDPGTADTLSYSWKWSDAVTNSGANITRTFSQNGTYTVVLTVTDDDGGTTTANGSIVIGNVAPTITMLTCTPTAKEGEVISCSASATDPGADSLTYSWAFGDGTTGTGQAVTKTYGAEGTFTITLTVRDQDSATATGTQTVVITNAAPTTPTISVSTPREEGTPITFTATATDPGNDTLTYLWNFGDSTSGSGASVQKTYADQGTFTVSVTVTDSGNLTSTSSTSVTVVNVNPTISSLTGDFSGNQGQTLTYTAVASDKGDDILTYTWDFGDGSPTTKGTDKSTVTHVYSQIGTYTLKLTVDDGEGGTASLTRTVNIGNGAPSISSLTGDTSGDEGDTFRYTVTASDPGNDALTYVWDFGDGSAPLTAGVNVAHVYADNGTYVVHVTVTDVGGLSTSSSLSVLVKNVAPTISTMNGPTSLAQGASGSFSATATDPGADTFTYVWSWGDGTANSTGASASHSYCKVGSLVVTLTVTDDDGGTASRTLTVTVSNVVPVLSGISGPTELNEGQTGSWSASASEVCNQSIQYNWNFGDGGSTSTTTVSHAYADNGTFTLSLTVADPDGGSASASLTITVKNVNPDITSVTIPTSAQEGDSVTFKVTASDVPADILTYRWTFGDATSSNSATVSKTYYTAGTYPITITVTDDDGGSATRNGTLVVGNSAPEIADFVIDEEGSEGNPISASFSASDPSGQAPTATLDWGDGTVEVVTPDTLLEHTYADDGSYEVVLEVTDGDAVVIENATVEIINLPPVIAALDVTTFAQEGDPVNVSVQASDPAGSNDPLTYSYLFGDGSPVEVGTSPTATHSYDTAGSYLVTITVMDDDGGATARTATVNINTAGPIITKLEGDLDGLEGDTLFFSAEAQDPTGQALTYTWSFGDDLEPQSGANLTSIEQVFPEDGSYTVTLVVEDTDGLTSSSSLSVEISNVAPEISSIPEAVATAEVEYVYSATAVDPGGIHDPLTWTLLTAPTGATVDNNGVVRWTPSLEDARAGTATFLLEVEDDDGASDSQGWTLTLNVIDTDNDGMPDSWEADNELDPLDPTDAGEDPDGDGQTNLEEYQNGTDPNTSDAPSIPVLLSPIDGVEVPTLAPELVVQNATVPNGTLIAHDFQLFADEELTVLVIEGTSSDSSDGNTRFEVPTGLEENGHYFWRARATATYGTGAWSDAEDFYVNLANDAPSAPGIFSPEDGDTVPGPSVTLTVTNAVDPDRDVVRYVFEIFEEGNSLPLSTSLSQQEGTTGLTRWTVPIDLEEDLSYVWHARAVDDNGVQGPWSESAVFMVSGVNTPPAAVRIVTPDAGEVVGQALTIESTTSEDPDGDVVRYFFQLDVVEDFDSSSLQEELVEPDSAQATRAQWEVFGLAEDTVYFTRVRAEDPFGASDWSEVVSFFVSEDNNAPSAPTLLTPADGEKFEERTITFTLENATDPEGDALQHTFEILDSNGNLLRSESVNEGDSDWTQLTFDLSGLPAGTYQWTAYASDAEGLAGPRAAAFGFELESPDNATPPVSIGGTGCGCNQQESVPLSPGWIGVASMGLGSFLLRRRRLNRRG